MKKRLDYNLETSEESEQSSDSDRPGPSHRKHGKKSVGGSRKGKGKVNVETESSSSTNNKNIDDLLLTEIERSYLASYDRMLRDSSTTTDRGIDVNVRIDDLDMRSIRKAVYRAYDLMEGRPGFLSINAGALLRSTDGNHIRLWYPSGNGINITLPGRPTIISKKADVDKLLAFISKNLDRIIENAKQSFPASGWVIRQFTNLKIRVTFNV